jgi:predicted nucleic acid-binding protein
VSIVLDANVLVVLVSGDPRRGVAETHMRQWITTGEDIHAPTLLPYEVANGLTRLVVAGLFPSDRVGEAWQTVSSLPITYHLLKVSGDRVVETALKLRRQSAYDAAYLVLVQELGAELWTFDGPLARNAAGLGFPVNLIE